MSEACTSRRRFLKLSAATGAAVGLASTLGRAGAQGAASVAKPGDLLVYQDGPKKGQPVQLADLKVGVAVWTAVADPATKQPRDAAKGGVVVVKLASGKVKASSKPNALGDVVAYSSLCTHQGCPTKELGSLGQGKGNIICTCHGSIFDPGDNAKVLGGPAPRRLAALPLKKDDSGQLVAKAAFTGKVGP
ncbi:ubiquinol-cytochrome c reductase iron-sulfur subunit [Deinococcus sp. RM]|uniref:QcrA and Rieske domain-containing protein n=1 Tax=Deinococcus sp. RM TaxID=2316359 RepID=UPI000E67BC5B|nr:Rieske (2Fe-2S) protein [Deinococcus sp. RM]RIY15315.1 twin-arginine translocation signal domain-containing protein [Deinococcus sp. RM]